jgi:hypothetical protein
VLCSTASTGGKLVQQMDTQHAAIYSLPPELSHHILKHLCKLDKQQFSICCKHMYVCVLAAIRSLILSHKCLASGKTTRLKTVSTLCSTGTAQHIDTGSCRHASCMAAHALC